MRRKKVSGIEHAVADEFKSVAVKCISAGFRNSIHGSRRVISILRRQRAGLHLELLQGVGEGQRQVQIVAGIVMVSTIQKVGHRVSDSAGDGNDNCRVVAHGVQTCGPTGAWSGHPGQENQFRGLPSV